MPTKIFTVLLFLLFSIFFTPIKASVYKPQNTNHSTISKHYLDPSPPKKEIDKWAVLAVFLCLMAGGMGVHRVVMGGSPWLILAYTFTFGGFFGLLPLMDFVRLLSEAEHYKNNHKFLAAFGAM